MSEINGYPCPPVAVIFDMDGLLVDSERLWKVAETALLADRGVTYSEEKHAPFIGMALPEFIPAIKRVYELDDDVDTLTTELMGRITGLLKTDTRPQPGAQEAIDFVLAHDIPHSIASSSPIAVIEATLSSQPGWTEAFPITCSADEVELGKPAPDVYLLAAERLGVDPTQCVALEDSPNGSRAAVAAGMTCFSVPDLSHTTLSAFDGVTPHVFGSLHEVLPLLKSCYGGDA
jgi:beta-phosphoglucomutase-like phosphatase (HAD superfamily)